MNLIFVILIAIVVILLLIGINAYVLLRITGLFGVKKSWIVYSLVGLSTIVFIIASVLVMKLNFAGTRWFYTLTGIYEGALFLAIFILLIFEIVNLLIKIDGRIAGFVILGIIFVISLYSVINASFIRVHTINLEVDNLASEMKIVQISDVHLGAVNGYNYMKKIVDLTNNQNPHVVLITGDMFDGSGDVSQETINLINNIKADVFFSTGNHEDYYGLDKALKQLGETKIKILRNKSIVYNGIEIIGEDNPGNFGKGNEQLAGIKFNKTIPSILMFHQPIGIKQAEEAGITLQLSGHAHEGQIFPFGLFQKLVYPMSYGLYKLGNTSMYATSGTGTWGPKMRFLTNSEIVVINLKPKIK